MPENPAYDPSLLPLGAILQGVYRIDEYLSSGGFGKTYKATRLDNNSVYAVKEFFLRDYCSRDEGSRTVKVSIAERQNTFSRQMEKFKKEAKRLTQFTNPHIIGVYDLFEANGTAYYVMDYVEGEDLGRRLKRTEQPLKEADVVDILRQLLDALQTIHSDRLWHLDLKPANIMMDNWGQVKIIDFGSSKQFDAQSGGATSSTEISYTKGYAPREQMEENYEKIGPWTDFYALGASLYNLLTANHPPMPTDIDDDVTDDKHIALPFPYDVSSGMRSLILRLMCTHRDGRPSSVQEIRDMVDGFSPLFLEDPNGGEYTVMGGGQGGSQTEGKPYEGSGGFTGVREVNYLSHPFKPYVVSILSALIIVGIVGYLTPGFFFTFGGSLSLRTISSIYTCSCYLFYIASAILVIPLIIGLYPISKKLSSFWVLSPVLIITRLVYNGISDDSKFNEVVNWSLFYGYHVLYFISGMVMIVCYKGNLRRLGKIFAIYSPLCVALNIPLNCGIVWETILQYFVYDILVWGVSVIWVYGMWWILTRKQQDNI